MLTRAWATLDIKAYDLDTREIEGIATTPKADSSVAAQRRSPL